MGSCNGDSGGPLFVYDPTGATPPVQVGVVSWGSSQCIGTPTVFARVSEEIAWINSYIDLWSGGGGGGPNPTPTPPSPTPPGTCTNDPNFIDSYGDDCSWYEENDPDCSFGDCCDIGNGTTNTACCICGGGITGPVAPVTPAPVTPAPVTPASLIALEMIARGMKRMILIVVLEIAVTLEMVLPTPHVVFVGVALLDRLLP